MNILVTGACGQLGNELRIVSRNSTDKYIFTDVVDAQEESITLLKRLGGNVVCTDTIRLDITSLDAIRRIVQDERIDTIINCAAYTNVDAAEDNYAMAERLNANAVENLAVAMKETGGLLLQISTDYVFGGDSYNTPCLETQRGTPTGVYGVTKLHGEEAIRRIGCKHVIIRTSWLYSEFGKNFVKTMLILTKTKPQLKVVFDQVGTPTYAKDLADVILLILKQPIVGVFNFSNEGVCSWFDFAKMIADYSGNSVCDIQPCHSCDFPSKVKRPSFSVLDKTKIKDMYGVHIPYWTDSLRACIKNLERQF